MRFPSILFLLLSFAFIGADYEAAVQNLSGSRYASKVIEEIQKAEQTIFLVMYLVEYNPENRDHAATKLIDALVQARTRGVEVKVLLDQNVEFKEDLTRDQWQREGKNLTAYDYLTENNIQVLYTDPETYTHSKVVIIDEEVLIMGSANWSESSLSRNLESNVLIRSPELAKDMLKDFSEVKTQVEQVQFLERIYVSFDFLENPKLLRQFVANNDQLELDTYLFLLKEYNDNAKGKVLFNFDAVGEALNLSQLLAVGNYRRQLRLVLENLKEDYRLIDYEDNLKSDRWDIYLLDYENEDKPYQAPLSRSFSLPTTYWTYQWNSKLSVIAKALLFINYAQVAESGGTKQWFSSIPDLQRTYHYGPRSLKQGLEELRRWNLVDLENEFFEGDSRGEGINYHYRVTDFYDRKILKGELNELKISHSPDQVGFAQKIAEVLYKEKDVEVLKRMIELREQYGNTAMQKAAANLRKENSDSPRRTLEYFEAVLKDKPFETL